MKYTSLIDNVKANEWKLNIQEAYLFSWLHEVPTWADHIMIGAELFYFAARQKAIEDLPILTEKPDTMYRYYKALEKHGLVVITKVDNREYVRITEKGKEWNLYGKENRSSDYSEKNPNDLGKKSENNSENFPTDTTISIDTTISDNNYAKSKDFAESSQTNMFGEEPKSKKEKKKESPRAHPAFKPIIDFFCKEYWPDYNFFGARDGKAVNDIIKQSERILYNHGESVHPEKVVGFVKTVIETAPQFYQKKSLNVISSKFSEIIEEIKKINNGQTSNSKPTSKYRSEAI